jgi:hypothetical protein
MVNKNNLSKEKELKDPQKKVLGLFSLGVYFSMTHITMFNYHKRI